MTVRPWEHVKDLLRQAMRLAPEERASFLDEACSSDHALRADVESLLSADERVRSEFLQTGARTAALPTLSAVAFGSSGLQAGQVFDERFRLSSKLGEGGMGQVWLAEQTAPVQRKVALKLIRAGMYDEGVLQRFQLERQSLAIMDHPAIAKVFDAGTTPQGQPYFVMEYVPGLAITEYCDQRKLNIRDRLGLFIQACEGVQHAHLKAIIHRDLKPANILVVDVDGTPVPRIIDFGLAKAVTPPVDGETLFTHHGHFLGTPGYMSPEQADPNVHDIDTRTDVYSLGVVLYVLLAGLQPFESKKRQPFDEWFRKVREEEPPSPSSKVVADRETTVVTAAARATEPRQLVRELRGDLDWITMKALERDRARRYASPSELAADIRRYLNHEPVEARPASAGYRIRKYVRRHRVGVGLASGLAVLLASFLLLQAVQLRRITRERDRANSERDRATRITDFMSNMFKVPDPNEARGNKVTAREILDKASTDIGSGLAKDPDVQSQMAQVMASTYVNLGLFARAHELAKSALDARLSLHGPDDPKTLQSMAQLGWILNREGQFANAEKMEREALAGERKILGAEDPLTLETMNDLATVLEGQGLYDEEDKLEREVIEISTRKLGLEGTQTMDSIEHLGNALLFRARYPEAEREYRRVLDLRRRVSGSDSPETLAVMHNLAWAIRYQDRWTEAEQMEREVLAGYQRVLGPEHSDTAIAMEGLAGILVKEGRLAEAETLDRQALDVWLKTFGPEHHDTLTSKHALSLLLFKEGRVQEAETMQREILATSMRVLGPEHDDTLESQSLLAEVLNREGRYAEAEQIARKTYGDRVRILGPQHPHTLETLKQLGKALAHSHRYGEATGLFREAIEKQDPSGEHGNRWLAWYGFACAADAANRPDEALQYLQEAVNRGYKDPDRLLADYDLRGLHDNAGFQQVVAELKRKLATPRSP